MEEKTLYEIIQDKCLYIAHLHDYLEWRGQKVERTGFTRMLKGERPISDAVKKVVNEWIANPLHPKYFETK